MYLLSLESSVMTTCYGLRNLFLLRLFFLWGFLCIGLVCNRIGVNLKGCHVGCRRLWNHVVESWSSLWTSGVFYLYLVVTANVYLFLPDLYGQSLCTESYFWYLIFLAFAGLRRVWIFMNPIRKLFLGSFGCRWYPKRGCFSLVSSLKVGFLIWRSWWTVTLEYIVPWYNWVKFV